MIEKTAMITLLGRPNVGKSTLINRLTGEKVAIVTNKPQTTRSRIYGVVNRERTQLVLLDTPGFHKARTRLGDYMVNVARASVVGVDAAALIVEPIANAGPQERQLIEHIRACAVPAILVINKIDTVKKEELLAVIKLYAAEHDFTSIVPISAKRGDGVEELMREFEKFAVSGPGLFPEDMVTDQPEKQIIAELIREKLLICMDREVPHGVAVGIEKFTGRGNGIIDIEATIFCEKRSHKAMIIGKDGAMLKKIGRLAREDIEAFMGAKVFLQTWVKVKENWRDNQGLIRNFGYGD